MNPFPLLLLLTLFFIGMAAAIEAFAPNAVTGILREGFSSGGSSAQGDTAPGQVDNLLRFWSSFTSRRHDIDDTQEEAGYIRDTRYFNDYVDVSRLGVPYDFCRVIASDAVPDAKFFACALAGTENLSSTDFRTDTTTQGFRLSPDDYMADTTGDGRADYCRILPWMDGSFQPVCALARDLSFDSREVTDPNPPDDIVRLLNFYQGCIIWYRFNGNILDLIGDTNAAIAGNLSLDERPRGESLPALQFNGVDQYLRLSDSQELSLGSVIPLRSIRAWMVWVYFDEFTNNAKIFDFGNGSSSNNVFLGILNKGDPPSDASLLQGSACEAEPKTVPKAPSGAQPVMETTPKNWMETSAANVNDYTSGGFELAPRTLAPLITPTTTQTGPITKATILYEVWDKQDRKMRVKLNAAVPLKEWTHITITATSRSAFRPNISFYINGKRVFMQESGFLPATSKMTNCYIGKSNWRSDTSQLSNSDELFKGSLFDFRAYSRPLSEDMIQDSYQWGRGKLGLA